MDAHPAQAERGSTRSVEAAAPRNLDRLVVRITTSWLLNYLAVLRDLFEQDLTKGLVFIGFVHANIGHLDRQPDTRGLYAGLDPLPPDTLARPMRWHKIAQSLGLPRETVRRKVLALQAEGYLREADRGLMVTRDLAILARLEPAVRRATTSMIRLTTVLAQAGLCPPPAHAEDKVPADTPHRAINRQVMGFFLRSMDEVRRLFGGDILTGVIFCAVIDANTAHLAGQPTDRFVALEDHVPDDLRRPISALALAGRLGLTRETVRRHVRKLEAMDACTQTADGLVVTQAVLRRPAIVEATARNGANMRRLLRGLDELGFFAETAPAPPAG
jgi:DNA-binding Lrp family transcriptional regulator